MRAMIAQPSTPLVRRGPTKAPSPVTRPNNRARSNNQFSLPLPVRPVIVAVSVETGSASNLIFGDVGPEATQTGVIVQLVPGDGVLLAAKTQESAKRQNRVGNLTGLLVDHEPLHRANPIAVAVVDDGPFNAVALDQWLAGHGAGCIRFGHALLLWSRRNSSPKSAE